MFFLFIIFASTLSKSSSNVESLSQYKVLKCTFVGPINFMIFNSATKVLDQRTIGKAWHYHGV